MRRRNYMLVVFYDITPAIIAVVLLALVLIDGASTAILNTLGFLCLVLVIRSVFINLKRITKSGIILRIINIIIDIVRVYMFYRLFYSYAANVQHAGGISSFIDLVIVVFFGGVFFFISEVLSALANPPADESFKELKLYTIMNLFLSGVFDLIAILLLYIQ